MSDLTLPLALLPATAKPFDVVCFGESSVDLVSVVDVFPKPDEKLNSASFDLFPGGQAATAAVACARLGWRTRYVGCLGTDQWGELISSNLAAERVDAAVVTRAGARSRTATILVERSSGRRTVIEHRDVRQRLGAHEVDPATVTSGRTLLVDATNLEASIAAARMAREAAIPTILDVERSEPGVDDLLAETDIMIVTGGFATSHTGEAEPVAGLRRLAARFRPTLAVVTLGRHGAFSIFQEQELRTEAPAVDVVDTTGAGDAFRGGFIAGWLRFAPAPSISQLLEYASTVAALNCTSMGAQRGLPNRELVDGLFTTAYRRQSK